MAKLTTYQIEVFIDEKYLNQNEIANGENRIIVKAFGARHKIDRIDNMLTHGIGINENTPLETVYPSHCIRKILVTDMSKK